MRLNSATGWMVARLIGIALTAMATSYGQVTNNVLLRTFPIQASEFGTTFTIEVDGRQYLITAKHVVEKLPNEAASTIQIREKNGWVPLSVTVFKCDDPADIAVLVPPAQLTVSYSLEPESKGLELGQDAYFVGYPYGTEFIRTYNGISGVFGLVKKVAVAQFDSMPERNMQRLLLDGYNNPGFSGSPLVWRDLSQSGLVLKVAGVIASYESNVSPVLKKTEIQENQITAEDRTQNRVLRTTDGHIYRLEDTGNLVQLNTGIATAWDIGTAVTLIRKHPIGPKVSDAFIGQ
jgi:S1-C subfamily serine protease